MRSWGLWALCAPFCRWSVGDGAAEAEAHGGRGQAEWDGHHTVPARAAPKKPGRPVGSKKARRGPKPAEGGSEEQMSPQPASATAPPAHVAALQRLTEAQPSILALATPLAPIATIAPSDAPVVAEAVVVQEGGNESDDDAPLPY